MILKNIRFLVTQNREREIFENVDLEIKDDRIKSIGRGLNGRREIDCSERIVMPGLVNTHTHAAMTLLRGISDNKVLDDWLNEDIFPAEEALNETDAYFGALLASIEMLESGTTTFNDMYFHMESVAKAVEDTGIRALLSRGLTDIEGPAYESLFESEEFIKKYKEHELIRPGIAPHAIYTCSEGLLKASRKVADRHDAPFHIHVSETEKENSDAISEHGMTPVQYLSNHGILTKNTIVAHATWLNDTDKFLIAQANAGVAHNPAANLKLGNGVADVPSLIEQGIKIGIGTDGVASNNNLNLFEEAKLAGLLHKRNDPRDITEQEVLDMLTISGARVLGMEDEIGSIEEGKKADIVMIDTDDSSLTPYHGKRGLVSNLVFSFDGDVSEVIVNGKFVYTGEGVLVDEERVREEVQERAERITGQ
ncbi:MAG: amidohydrolase family protein [Candidatus Nanohaloarchaea archaeon]